MTSEQTQDAPGAANASRTSTSDGAPHQAGSGGDDVIVVSSQPSARDAERPPQRLRSLGSVSSHATEAVTGDGRPRRGGGRRGNPLLSLLLTAVPLTLAALGIRLLEGRTVILAATGTLVVVWLLGIAAAWRGLGPRSRDSRGGIWLGRAIGLVIGALAAVYLLLDTVSPLL